MKPVIRGMAPDPAHHVDLKKSPLFTGSVGKMLQAEAGGIKDRQILRRPR